MFVCLTCSFAVGFQGFVWLWSEQGWWITQPWTLVPLRRHLTRDKRLRRRVVASPTSTGQRRGRRHWHYSVEKALGEKTASPWSYRQVPRQKSNSGSGNFLDFCLNFFLLSSHSLTDTHFSLALSLSLSHTYTQTREDLTRSVILDASFCGLGWYWICFQNAEKLDLLKQSRTGFKIEINRWLKSECCTFVGWWAQLDSKTNASPFKSVKYHFLDVCSRLLLSYKLWTDGREK